MATKGPRGKRVRTAGGGYSVRGKCSNGEGSVYRETNGAWRATYQVPGEPRPRRVRGRTREEAICRRDVALAAALEKAEAAAASGPRLGKTPTLAEFGHWWLETVAQHRVRVTSLGKYVDRVDRISDSLGDVRVAELRPEQIAEWQSSLLKKLASGTVSDTRATLSAIMDEAVNLGHVASNPVARVKPPIVRRKPRRALSAAEARALVTAASPDRLGAAVALLFVQGWRVSEALGLAWADLDLDGATATVRRAAVYADGIGMMLGPPKTAGAEGRHFLAPVVVELLRRRRKDQLAEQAAAGPAWTVPTYEGQPVRLVFTTTTGGLVVRQAMTKAIAAAAEAAGIDPKGLSTHAGRSTAITALYVEEGIDLADVARHVGHASPATTAGYVRHLGQRPRATADAASKLLDPTTHQA